MPSSQAIVDEVKQNPKGIGYVGLGYLESNIKALKVKKDADHRSHTHRGISSGWQLSRLPPAVHVLKQGVFADGAGLPHLDQRL